MSNPQSPQALPIAAGLAAGMTDDEAATGEPKNTGATVGASDAEADAARSGADADLTNATRDDDGVPVGADDLEADKRNSGA